MSEEKWNSKRPKVEKQRIFIFRKTKGNSLTKRRMFNEIQRQDQTLSLSIGRAVRIYTFIKYMFNGQYVVPGIDDYSNKGRYKNFI